jgi:hypothetical protein
MRTSLHHENHCHMLDKFNILYQTSLDLLSILLQGFSEVLPVLFNINIIEFVIAPLTVTNL